MEFFKALKEKHEAKRQKTIRLMAKDLITLVDSEGRICIAFNGNPLFPVCEDYTTSEILNQLDLIRDNYIESKLKEYA